MPKHSLTPAAFVMLLAHAAGALAANGLQEETLADYSLEQLSDIVVTSVSRQESRVADAPAAVYVITASDIARSGATTLPEALRLAPNLQVARRDASGYAISARGFSTALSNKMLVLIDGRSVYSPLFSGVYWESQDVPLSDVERIEVISGPGGTVWGANAVNGVINVITKSARDTQGGQLKAAAGADEGSGTVRYGGKLGNDAWYRTYAKQTRQDDTIDVPGGGGEISWRRSQAGFRIDAALAGGALTFSGDAYEGRFEQAAGAADISTGGANLLARFTHRLADGGDLRLQAYIDHTRRDQPSVRQRLDTVDVEAEHDMRVGASNKLAWGGGYRDSVDRLSDSPIFVFAPPERNLRWFNLFVQDEISVTDAVRAIAGVKAEHNVYTGTELMPSLRVAWNPSPQRMVWAALSRAVRAPSRIDRDVMQLLPGRSSGPPWALAGGPQFESETARVAELGYRAQPSRALSWSGSVFYSKYDHLRTVEPGTQGALFENLGVGRARGIELWGNWQPVPTWRLGVGGVVQDVETGLRPGSRDVASQTSLAPNDPHNYWSLRSSHDLAGNVRADFMLRHVGALPHPAVPAYTEFDAHLDWKVRPDIELGVTGRNLLHPQHAEFNDVRTRQYFVRTVLLTVMVLF